jgi:hypothetical protein
MVRIWCYTGDGKGCDMDGCQAMACWWLEGVEVVMCDSCLLALLRQFTAEERVCLTIAKFEDVVGIRGATQ